MARHKQTQATRLPGTIYLSKNRYWWKVKLPGESALKARPLKPIGSRYAATDYAVAVECAKQLLQQHLFKQRIPHQGDIKTIPDLVRAYKDFAREYYIDNAERPDAFMPAELERPSGILDMKMAITVTMLTPPPASMVRPIAMDSGMPSKQGP